MAKHVLRYILYEAGATLGSHACLMEYVYSFLINDAKEGHSYEVQGSACRVLCQYKRQAYTKRVWRIETV